MPLIQNQKGISLIELLLGFVLVAGVMVTLSLAFPTNNKNLAQNQHRWVATSLANNQIQSLKSQPYDFVDTTDVSRGAFNATCDCNQFDFASLPSTSTTNASMLGTNFTVASCVNFVTPAGGNTWTPQCSTIGDTGYKHILIKAYWTVGTSTSVITQESMLTRS